MSATLTLRNGLPGRAVVISESGKEPTDSVEHSIEVLNAEGTYFFITSEE
jgi:hypothetical protein